MTYSLSYGLFSDSPTDLSPETRDKILAAMDAIADTAATALTNDIDRTIQRLLAIAQPLIDAKDVKGIQDLNVGLHLALQRSLFLLVEQAWLAGQTHALEEMKAALPPEYQNPSQVLTFSPLTDRIKKLVWGLFRMTPKTFRNTPAETALKRRVIKLAGNFSKDTLEEVRSHILSSVIPSPTQGVIDRAELVRRLQGTLGVARRRAIMIAQTETTNLYNQGRMDGYKSSKLTTHVQFMALKDARVSDICKSRNGLVLDLKDKAAIAQCTPACHVNCRSVLSPILSVAPNYQELIEDPSRMFKNRVIVPLSKGWRSG